MSKQTKRRRWATKAVLLVVLVGMTACRPQEIELPFETIARPEGLTDKLWWDAKEPGLIIVADSEDLTQLGKYTTQQDALPQLREIDFDNHFVVAIFLGWRGSTHEGITLEQVIRQGNAISLYTRVGRSTGKDAATSPYHLVKVRKEGNWNRTFHFTLYMDGTKTKSLSHFIP